MNAGYCELDCGAYFNGTLKFYVCDDIQLTLGVGVNDGDEYANTTIEKDQAIILRDFLNKLYPV